MDIAEGIDKIRERVMNLDKEPIIIGIAGCSASGKSYLARNLGYDILSIDDYYRGYKHIRDNNFDEPHAIDFELLKRHLKLLKEGKTILKPIYDFKTMSRIGYKGFKSDRVLILEGLFALNEDLKDEIDIKVFVDCDLEKALDRRVNRDMKHRGATKEHCVNQWEKFAKPMYFEHVLPTKKFADVVVEN